MEVRMLINTAFYIGIFNLAGVNCTYDTFCAYCNGQDIACIDEHSFINLKDGIIKALELHPHTNMIDAFFTAEKDTTLSLAVETAEPVAITPCNSCGGGSIL